MEVGSRCVARIAACGATVDKTVSSRADNIVFRQAPVKSFGSVVPKALMSERCACPMASSRTEYRAHWCMWASNFQGTGSLKIPRDGPISGAVHRDVSTGHPSHSTWKSHTRLPAAWSFSPLTFLPRFQGFPHAGPALENTRPGGYPAETSGHLGGSCDDNFLGKGPRKCSSQIWLMRDVIVPVAMNPSMD